MAVRDNLRAVQSAYDAFKRGDVDELLKVMAEDIEWIVPGAAEVPFAGVRRGHEGVREFVARLNAAADIEEFTPEHYVAQGDRVAVVGHERLRVKATGAVTESNWVHVFTLRGGIIVKFREYRDTLADAAAFRPA